MEVRRIMIPPGHLNHDTIEDTDRRHNRCLLARLVKRRCSITRCWAYLTQVKWVKE
jgi:hypothetical protein